MRFRTIPQLPASDLVRARAWYDEMLGLLPRNPDGSVFDPGDADPATYSLEYDSDGACFGVYTSRHAGKNEATAMRLVTDEFDALHERLLARGAHFETYEIEGNFHEPDGTPYWDRGALVSPDGEKTAWLKDPEGNVIAIGTCR